MGLHPSEILIGYEKAAKKIYEELEKQTCYELKSLEDSEEVLKCMKSAISSKQFGLEDLLGKLITQACLYAIPKGTRKLHVDNIRVVKILGGSIYDSEVAHGMVIIRQSETSIHRVQ